MICSSPEAYRLMMEGSRALCDVEQHGMRIDEQYLDKMIEWSGKEIKRIEFGLREDAIFRIWRKRFGARAELGSRDQFQKILTEDLGLSWSERTKSGKASMDEDVLEKIDLPFVKRWLSLEKLKKARSTYLIGLKKEVVDGLIHPFLHLHLASTYRSSGTDPNLQNQPIRDKKQAKLIRRAFIPRTAEYALVEADFGALEFKGAACKWEDEKMIEYASDPSLDIHRDMGAECFAVRKDQVTKEIRYFGKNGFVFPILYGSYFGSCAESLWGSIQGDLKLKDGTLVRDHLKSKGIDQLGSKKGGQTPGTFMWHMKKVEERFHKRFPTWSQNRDNWWDLYVKRGWFPLLTGFVCKGIYSYNNLMNTPIQGPCFHLLLWSLIEINKELKRRKMRSMVICEIHDSLIIDTHIGELQDVLHMSKEIMTERIRKHWSWILTPLSIEVDVAFENWYEKKPWVEKGGEWKEAS